MGGTLYFVLRQGGGQIFATSQHLPQKSAHVYIVTSYNRILHTNNLKHALPEINTVRAYMTRTSLVDRISLLCCTCTNNIQLVCGKCKLEVTSTPPAKRPRHITVLCITTALEMSWALGRAIITASTASYDYAPIATCPLPEGCHEVECLGANRRKVIALLSLCFFAFSNGGYKAIGTLMFKH